MAHAKLPPWLGKQCQQTCAIGGHGVTPTLVTGAIMHNSLHSWQHFMESQLCTIYKMQCGHQHLAQR